MAFITILALLLLPGSASLPVNNSREASTVVGAYTGYKLLEIQVSDSARLKPLLQQLQNSYQVDVWGHSPRGHADVMVSPATMNDVIGLLHDRQASYRVKVQDVQTLLEATSDHIDRRSQRHRRRRRSVRVSTVTRRYLRFRQIRQFLRTVKKTATVADVTVSSLGRTFERRVTPYVTIRQKNSASSNKSVVVIEAGIHAREWIAPAMALNIIYKLSFNPDNDSEVEELLQKFDWVIIPVSNPDGYIYSQRNTSTRLWRKTRTSLYAFGNSICFGVDGNRNFGYQWTDNVAQGGSSNPCHDNYSGPQGFSEPETRNLRSLLLRLRGRGALFIALHSYGQYFLYPWGYDSFAVLEDEEDLREVANQFADVMYRNNRWYETGPSARVLYEAAGASDDFARGGAGIKFAFTVELSPSDSSVYGFLLPPRRIASVVQDHWPAFKTVARAVWNKMSQTTTTTTTTTTASPNDDSMTEVTIYGHTFRLNMSDPAVAQWMEHYIDFLFYRDRLGGL